MRPRDGARGPDRAGRAPATRGPGPSDGRPPVLESPVLEFPVLESPVLESPVLESPVLESPTLESPVLERPEHQPPHLVVAGRRADPDHPDRVAARRGRGGPVRPGTHRGAARCQPRSVLSRRKWVAQEMQGA